MVQADVLELQQFCLIGYRPRGARGTVQRRLQDDGRCTAHAAANKVAGRHHGAFQVLSGCRSRGEVRWRIAAVSSADELCPGEAGPLTMCPAL